MLLKKVNIKNFKCIDDSGFFDIDKVTCLVGKNESGKTAILKALHRIKPENEEVFKPSMDYPKKRWMPDMGIPKDEIVISKWELEDSDIKKIDEEFGVQVIGNKNITIEVGYDNERSYSIEYNEKKLIKNLIEKYGIVLEEGTTVSTIENLQSFINGMPEKTETQVELLGFISKHFSEGVDIGLIHFIDNLVPTFLYFDQYTRLPGSVSINEFSARKTQNKLSNNDEIFVALMDIAGTSIDAIITTATFEEFNSSMRAVSNHISDEIFAYWSQNKHLEVDLKFDTARPGDPAPFNSGYVFRTRINNKRHRADTSFDERSSGFVWFFSFLVWFQYLKKTYDKNMLILLDEPGLTLHSRAQGDLLRYINEQLKPNYQVIYTTHSPFMIDTDNILSARTVEDVVIIDKKTKSEILLGTKVSGDVLSSDPDTISPLQRALDYEITQSLFIGKNNILVEGESDFLYLKWFSRKLEQSGREGLDYRWTISIVRGIDKIPGYISLFGANLLHIVALIDYQTGHKQRIEQIKKSLKDNHLITANEYTEYPEKQEADIEDVLGNKFYTSLVNYAYRLNHGLQIDDSKIKNGDTRRITSIVNDYFATLPPAIKEFDHYFPAECLYDIEDHTSIDGTDEAMNCMEKIFIKINSLLK